MPEQMNARDEDGAEAFGYLTTGGLPEVLALAEAAKFGGAPKVQMDTEMAIVLCQLAAEAIDRRGIGQPTTAEEWGRA